MQSLLLQLSSQTKVVNQVQQANPKSTLDRQASMRRLPVFSAENESLQPTVLFSPKPLQDAQMGLSPWVVMLCTE